MIAEAGRGALVYLHNGARVLVWIEGLRRRGWCFIGSRERGSGCEDRSTAHAAAGGIGWADTVGSGDS